jgi:hypothetical protein
MKEVYMFIVKRQSRSGGAEYLVEATTRKGYRWGKVGLEQVRHFASRSSAQRNAEKYDGEVRQAF